MEEIDAAENAFPRSFMKPRAASCAEISRSDRWPPFGVSDAPISGHCNTLKLPFVME